MPGLGPQTTLIGLRSDLRCVSELSKSDIQNHQTANRKIKGKVVKASPQKDGEFLGDTLKKYTNIKCIILRVCHSAELV